MNAQLQATTIVPETSLEISQEMANEDIQDYVAQLQVHMTLQARNLVPNLAASHHQSHSQMSQLLQTAQAESEKLISRQAHR